MMYYISFPINDTHLNLGKSDIGILKYDINFSSLNKHLEHFYPIFCEEIIKLNLKTPFIYNNIIFCNCNDVDGSLTDESKKLIKKLMILE